jgi:hypothetical protein
MADELKKLFSSFNAF